MFHAQHELHVDQTQHLGPPLGFVEKVIGNVFRDYLSLLAHHVAQEGQHESNPRADVRHHIPGFQRECVQDVAGLLVNVAIRIR